MTDPSSQPVRYRFSRSRRLHGRRAFGRVYAARRRKHLGPITVYVKPNDLGYPRLGLSVSRKVGAATKRNRIKRMLREAFRLGQHDWDRGFDVVVVVRAHEPLGLERYRAMMAAVVRWAQRN